MESEVLGLYERNYMNESEENSGSAKIRKGKSKRNCKGHSKMVLKMLSKQMKMLKKQQRLLKRQKKQMNKATETLAFSETGKMKETKRLKHVEKVAPAEKSFWGKLSDAIIKAVPTVLTVLVGKVCSFIFKKKEHGISL